MRPSFRGGGLARCLILGDTDGSSSRGACIRLADVGRPGVIEHQDVTVLAAWGARKAGNLVWRAWGCLPSPAPQGLLAFVSFRCVGDQNKKARMRNIEAIRGRDEHSEERRFRLFLDSWNVDARRGQYSSL